MSYTLLIIESPAKCKKIESYLGSEYKCIASYGHIQELPGIKYIDIENNFKKIRGVSEKNYGIRRFSSDWNREKRRYENRIF